MFRKLVVIMGVAVLIGACAQKREKETAPRSRGGTGLNPVQGVNGGTLPGIPGGAQTGSFQVQLGDIRYTSQRELEVFVSASMDPYKDMEAPIAGVAIAGNIQISGSNNIMSLNGQSAAIASNSEMAIYIVDNKTMTQGEKAITIGFKPGTYGASVQGQIQSGNRADIQFSDQWGSVTLRGTYSQSEYYGDIYFRNKGGLAPEQDIRLGSFRVPTCGFFHCGN